MTRSYGRSIEPTYEGVPDSTDNFLATRRNQLVHAFELDRRSGYGHGTSVAQFPRRATQIGRNANLSNGNSVTNPTRRTTCRANRKPHRPVGRAPVAATPAAPPRAHCARS